jgi:DNA-binding transcriptional LysR family regulator
MNRVELNDLAVFAVVAEEKSFTRAAARLGMSASALSHAVKSLETRMGVRLLARTTRSVSTTDAGERLLRTLQPALEDISNEITALRELRDKPSGKLRITTFKYAAETVLWPVLPQFLEANPDIQFELTIDSGLVDIVADRYDAGIRFGGIIDKDMVAVRVGAPVKAAVVASPAYLAKYGKPKSPEDLVNHRCIGFRFKTAGNIYPWNFEGNGRNVQVKVPDAFAFNDNDMMLEAALGGLGIARLYEGLVASHIEAGRLVRLLTKWTGPGVHLYLFHTGRRQTPPALTALIKALKVHALR